MGYRSFSLRILCWVKQHMKHKLLIFRLNALKGSHEQQLACRSVFWPNLSVNQMMAPICPPTVTLLQFGFPSAMHTISKITQLCWSKVIVAKWKFSFCCSLRTATVCVCVCPPHLHRGVLKRGGEQKQPFLACLQKYQLKIHHCASHQRRRLNSWTVLSA